MRTLAPSVLVFALLLSSPSRANDSSYGGCSGALSAVASKTSGDAVECVPEANRAVALVDEVLEIDVTSQSAQVTARYTFTNTGEAATLTVGFPVQGPYEGEPDAPQESPLTDYTVTLDGAKAEYSVFLPARRGTDAAKAAATKFGYDAVYLTDVAFAAGQTRTIEHRYGTGASLVAFAYTPVRYILRTGANWKGGKIGKIAIRVRVAEPVAPLCLGASLPGMKWDPATRSFVFEAKNWRPTKDLYVTYAPASLHANIQFGSLENWPSQDELVALTDAAAMELLKGRSSADVLDIYTSMLEVLSATPSKPGSRELCSDEVRHLVPKADPTLRLSHLQPWLRRLLIAADAVLTEYQVKHPAPPAAE